MKHVYLLNIFFRNFLSQRYLQIKFNITRFHQTSLKFCCLIIPAKPIEWLNPLNGENITLSETNLYFPCIKKNIYEIINC